MDTNKATPLLCARGCGFFGSVESQNLCSKCYKEFLKQEMEDNFVLALPAEHINPSREINTEAAETATATAVVTSDDVVTVVSDAKVRNRCRSCKKKVGFTGFTCRCGEIFCGTHRYPEKHSCVFDYKVAGREVLARQNPVCKGDKLNYRI